MTDVEASSGEEFALKLLSNVSRRTRIEREIQTARVLWDQEARVLEVIDDFLRSDPDARRPWFVTQIVEGGSLAKHLVPGEPLGGSASTAIAAFLDLVGAVKGLHALKVAHRDLKPDNVLLGSNGVVLADLGLCLPLGDLEAERLTGELERIGSVNYLPPEAFGRRALDEDQFAFDAYALGKLLYQFLSGRQLPGFVSPNDPEYDLARSHDTPFYRGINRALRGLLNREPAVRLATLADLEEQLSDLGSASTMPQSTLALANDLSRIGELVARRVQIAPQLTPPGSEPQAAADELRDHLSKIWDQSSVLAEIQRNLVDPNPGIVVLQRVPVSQHMRQLLAGPTTLTRRGLEPVEDLGYPLRPTLETGVALAIDMTAAHAGLAAIWLSALIGIRDDRTFVAQAVIRTEKSRAPIDIVQDGAFLVEGRMHDASLVQRVEESAARALSVLARAVVKESQLLQSGE